MNLLRRNRFLTACLAALAVLLGALAPAAAQVVADARGQQWVQICSASGMAWVRLGADVSAEAKFPGEPAGDGQRHCPWCHLGDGAGLPPQPSGIERGIAEGSAVPFGAVDPVVQATWPAALSRAPPLA